MAPSFLPLLFLPPSPEINQSNEHTIIKVIKTKNQKTKKPKNQKNKKQKNKKQKNKKTKRKEKRK